jgi:hypothetical protein
LVAVEVFKYSGLVGLWRVLRLRPGFIIVNGEDDFKMTEVAESGRSHSRGYEHHALTELVAGLTHRSLDGTVEIGFDSQ